MKNLRLVNLILTGAGSILFGLLLAYVLLAPADFNNRIKGFVVAEVSERIDGWLPGDDGSEPKKPGLLDRANDRLPDAVRDRMQSLMALSSDKMQTLVTDVLVAACRLDCEREAAAKSAVGAFFEGVRADLAASRARLSEVIVGQYDRVLGELRADITIFTGTNFALFFMAFLLAALKGRAAVHLLPFSLALSVLTLVMSAWYLLGPDWLLTIIFSDYWGYAYPVFAGIVAVFLFDIALFRARLTSFVMNTVSSILGSALSVAPC